MANLREATALYLSEFPLTISGHPLITTFPCRCLPRLSRTFGAEIVPALQRLGFESVRQRGSHVVLCRGSIGCVVPLHDQIKAGTLAGILRQAGVSTDGAAAQLATALSR